MFENLPETIPQKSKKKPRAIVLAAGIHVVLVAAVIVVQMVMPEKLGEFQLLTTLYMAAPVTIPKDIARIIDSVPPAGVPRGVSSGVAGGAENGLSDGLLGGVLGGAGSAPPLPPPVAPVRVGGNVKQPRIVHIEQPKYPPEAKRAHIEGAVILEATVTAEGTVDKVKVISGPPMLVEPAVEAISHWKYEPTYLNGQAVPVILTARINFSLATAP